MQPVEGIVAMSRPRFRALTTKLALGATLALAACAGAGPPHGPEYDPSNTPDAHSGCPGEANAAKKAREDALGAEGSEAREGAAAAVFAQAECERRLFDALVIEGVSPEDFKGSIGAAKAQFYTAQNLYLEVVAFNLPEWAVAGYARAGDLMAAYAGKLRKSDPGPGVGEGTDRAVWLSEIEEVAKPVDRDALDLYGKALDVVMMGPSNFGDEPRIAPFVKSACRAISTGAPAKLDGYPPCR
jgi:hypothetical protein